MTPRHPHPLSASTHTVEMSQIADLNLRLAQVAGPTAAQLGLDGVPVHLETEDTLPGHAVLVEVRWTGAPEFPDIHGVFADQPGAPAHLVVDLHTGALRALSRHLGLRHGWGVGATRPGP